MSGGARIVPVSTARFGRWVENFITRHGVTTLAVADGALTGSASDGSSFAARLPFSTPYDGAADVGAFAAAVRAPGEWGVLLVRRGGFAVARLAGDQVMATKVGSRHVQSRTAAGGQSQQGFARRRDNQARQAFEAAADHAARVLEGFRGPVVGGGDREAVAEVLGDRRLAHLVLVEPWLPVPDPRRAVLDQAVADAAAVSVAVVNVG